MAYFLTAAGLLVLATLVGLARPLLRRGRPVETRADKDARLYRQQLGELDRDLERGVIGEAEAEGARAEIARRLIAATRRSEAAAAPAPQAATRLLGVATLIGLPVLAAMIYLGIGNPGQPDLPFATRGLEPSISTAGGPPERPSQAQAEALVRESGGLLTAAEPDPDYAALVERVEAVVAERGPDERGLTLLADGYLRLGRPGDAWRAYDELIALRGAEAPAGLHARKAEAMVMAARGYVSPEAERAVAAALAKDPAEPVARHYKAVAAAQAGRFDEALGLWRALRDEAEASSPWAETLDAMIAEIEAVRAAPAAPGPSASEIEAAAGMTPEERQAMIERMVGSLEARLMSEGGTMEEWLRLMTSYDRLGRAEDARRAFRAGAEALAGGDGASVLRQQALVLGIIDE
ncbi:MAG TPA: c-type cytochrome biogenesis protein CcmI [Thermohalobaculum sp.]|nr:c-type cytochrome biogenesis protein CcmI [Thermohalobaculum sp.]